MVDIDNDEYSKAKKLIESDKVTYPSIKNFVDKAIREKVEREMRRKNVIENI